jgi:hypothetical protein
MYCTLSDLVVDMARNAVNSGADTVELEVVQSDGEFRFLLKDNGRGMDAEELKQALDPFVPDVDDPAQRRKIGLGIPFLINTAKSSGGGCELRSQKNEGTSVNAWFDRGNAETPSLGDIPAMFRAILLLPGSAEVVIRRLDSSGPLELRYQVRKSELLDTLDGLHDAASQVLLGDYLQSLEEDGEE